MAELKVLKEEIQAISPESEHPLQSKHIFLEHLTKTRFDSSDNSHQAEHHF